MSSTKADKARPLPGGCFICGNGFSSEGLSAGFGGRLYKVVFCKGCGLGKTDPFLSDRELRAIYSSSYRNEDSTRFLSPLEKAVALVRNGRVRGVERFARKSALLDVGCGRGDFLERMRERGWTCHGLELDSRAARKADRLEIRAGSLLEAKYPDASFDAVTFWHVFEHVREPERTLDECRRVLKPGGLLVLAVPNSASMQARLTGGGWFHLDPPFHLYHYSAGALKRLLEKSGFEVLKVGNFSFEYNPYGFLQSIYNSMGLRHNLLYDFLRARPVSGGASALSLALVFLTLPVLAPVALLLSVVEALAGAGGTVELYARKR